MAPYNLMRSVTHRAAVPVYSLGEESWPTVLLTAFCIPLQEPFSSALRLGRNQRGDTPRIEAHA